ncbi:tRNA (adenosine(37)-N6)-threonylcarbamoyltransferase complex transferase subunit TsaD [Vampirovibrio chlorellavorus]|uniref:tRNA (adenosine(37)-N6)-threonylcarbamoyltransferase complex transferase subunit TsaD n=1 Tax=Vampirovibrio chlorellavorus TaxID=758823 RepID=UPI0026F35A58|nr:tRNA (adenosine(37)-N6)-threonylcarbamoyltransferase complex transferase subunit TsaD [Vampirovibrio chlorellavorus]
MMPAYRKILALESSCDDTAVAIVENGRRVLASVITSQATLHAQFGGVVPEAAAREHIESVNLALQAALDQAGCRLADVDAFAATLGPGLIGSLLVGANTGKTLSLITGKPFLGVNHLYAHVASNYLESDLQPPFLCLLVSGGHTQLIVVDDYASMRIVGTTLDDAVGEAYDKVARFMELPYPGGPVVDQLAAQGNSGAFALPRATVEGPYDFSFSGLKTATTRAFEKARTQLGADVATDGPLRLEALQRDMAASFQHTVVETLFEKTISCARDHGLQTIAIAGGVSANRGLRHRFERFVRENPDFHLYLPQLAFCTDNAAMVAASAYVNPITDDIRHEVFSRTVMAPS